MISIPGSYFKSGRVVQWIVVSILFQVVPISFQQPFTEKNYKYGTFHESIICSASHLPAQPSTLSEIQQIVRYALAHNTTVKAVGSRHSATDVICTDGLPIYMDKIRHFYYDPNSEVVTIGGGATLKYLTEKLHRIGRGLGGMAIYGGITVAGAIGTGAHGSSLLAPSTLSDQMVGLTVVDGLGGVRNISGGEPLRAFRTHLGLLGIIYEVHVRTVAQYKVQVTHQLLSDQVLDNPEEILGVARSHRFSNFWWFPSSGEVVISKGKAVSTRVPGECGIQALPESTREQARSMKALMYQLHDRENRLWMFILQNVVLYSLLRPIVGRTPFYTNKKGGGGSCQFPVTGWSHQMLAHVCKSCMWELGEDSVYVEETEVYIPLSELGGALKTIKGILAEAPTDFEANGLHFRFVTESDGILSSSRGSGGAWVAVEWMMFTCNQRFTKAKLGLAAKQAMIQALIAKHRGRSHWGKNGLAYTSPDMIQFQNDPDSLSQFGKFMEELDPHGIFLNDFGRRLKFRERKMTLDAERSEHCAVSEHCLCSRDVDCGANVEARCDLLQGTYPVCTQARSELDRDRIQMERNAISGLKPMFNTALRFLNGFALAPELFPAYA